MQKNDDRIAVYSRKSKFTGKGESIGNQVELSREYIRAHYGAAYAENMLVCEDEGFSGGNLDRPGFQKMMKAAEAHQFKAIVVYRLDRISRNVCDFSGLIEELGRLGIDFVSIREQFDTGTPMGRAMLYIASVFSQLERETIAERILDNMHELAKTGRWLGGTTPTGYASESVRSVTIDGKAKKACRLRLLADEAETVRQIYALYAESGSLTRTEAELLRRHVKTKNGNRYTRFSIKNILQNPVYAIADPDTYAYFIKLDADLFSDRNEFDGVHGILAYNRTAQRKGRAAQFLPVSSWILAVGQHPGIIPGRVWVSVQETLARGSSGSYRRPRRNEALLTGLLYCRCGSRMYPKLSRRRAADGKPVYAYVCKWKEHSQRSLCRARNAGGNALDAAVFGQLLLLEEHPGSFLGQLAQSRGFYRGDPSDGAGRLDALRRGRAETEKKIGSLVDSLAELADSGARAPVAQRIGQLQQACKNIDARLQALTAQADRHALSDTEFDALRQRLSSFPAGIGAMTTEQKRAAVRALVRKVVWDGAYAHVVLFGAPDEGIGDPEMPAAGGETAAASEQPAAADRCGEAAKTKRPGGKESVPAPKARPGEDSK